MLKLSLVVQMGQMGQMQDKESAPKLMNVGNGIGLSSGSPLLMIRGLSFFICLHLVSVG